MESSSPQFTEEELRKSILDALKRRAHADDLIFDLCKQKGWDWKKASDFVTAIQKEHGGEIEFLWAKIFSIAGIACLALGLMIFFYIVDVYIGWNNLALCVQQGFQNPGASNTETGPILRCLSQTFLGILQSLDDKVGYISITLILGGLAGYIIAQRQMKMSLAGARSGEQEN